MKRYVETHGAMPSYRQLARFVGVNSAATIHKHVNALVRKGAVAREYVEGAMPILRIGGVEHTLVERAETYAMPTTLRWQIWERDNFTCLNCSLRQDLTVDHIHPWQSGGSKDDPENLQTLCRGCNTTKGNKTIDYRQNSRFVP
jgi:hypothetical protein